ncbi:hypothetical protein ACI2LJ_27655 [Streptomyces sp. NPDC088090]|uniref:hypothetical protein n=1 Tax=Streptomyces sp. NPDC088090 TaxID=3365822 RepID=UPI00384D28BA
MTDRPAPTWLVRRNPYSRVLPWTWACTTRITRGGFTQVCTGQGDARTKDAAEAGAREHAATHTA